MNFNNIKRLILLRGCLWAVYPGVLPGYMIKVLRFCEIPIFCHLVAKNPVRALPGRGAVSGW